MGEAKRRGSYEERRAAAIARKNESPSHNHRQVEPKPQLDDSTDAIYTASGTGIDLKAALLVAGMLNATLPTRPRRS
jgi:hypothetical protein